MNKVFLFQAEINVENLPILWKISRLHFSFFVVRDHFLSWDRKWAMMSWISISRWYFRVAIESRLWRRGKPIFADIVEGQWLHRSPGMTAAEAHAATAELKPKPEALGWKMAPLFLGCDREIVASTCPGLQDLLLLYSTWQSCNGQAAQEVVLSQCKTADSVA